MDQRVAGGTDRRRRAVFALLGLLLLAVMFVAGRWSVQGGPESADGPTDDSGGEGPQPTVEDPAGVGTVQARPTTTTATTAPTTTTIPPPTTLPPPHPRPDLELASLQPSGPIVLDGQADVVIEGLWISNPDGECLTVLSSQRVTLRNSAVGPCQGRAVSAYLVDGLTVTGSTFTDVQQGIYALESTALTIEGNDFRDVGRTFIQFDKVHGASNRIVGNWGQNDPDSSIAVDLISLFQSNGTAESPILVQENRFNSGGVHPNGSGIMAGDGGGSFQLIERNFLMNPGQVGIGIAGGTDIVVRDNIVFSEARTNSNVGIYVWNQYEDECARHRIEGNTVNWRKESGVASAWWDGGNCRDLEVAGTNNWSGSVGRDFFE